MRKFFYFIVFSLSFFVANAQKLFLNDTVVKDLTYKVIQGDSVKLDIFQPTQKIFDKSPVVIFMHGGAWAKGDKEMNHLYYMRSLRDTLRHNGYAVVSINYRLVSKTTNIADQLADCNDALKWIEANAKLYNFDKTNMGLCGESAGAHLALLMLYKKDNARTNSGAKIKYVIDNFGPTDLNKVLKTRASFLTKKLYKILLPELYDIREKLVFAITTYDINAQPDQAIQVARDFSPIHFIQNNTQTPVMILHGSKDFVVSIKQSKKLQKKLKGQATPHKLIKVKKGQHGFKKLSNERIQELITEITMFIKNQTK